MEAIEVLDVELNETLSLSRQSAYILISKWSIGSDALRGAQEPLQWVQGPSLPYEKGFSCNAIIRLQGPCAGPQVTAVTMTELSLEESQASEEEQAWNQGEEGKRTGQTVKGGKEAQGESAWMDVFYLWESLLVQLTKPGTGAGSS